MDLRVIIESGGKFGYGHLSRTLVLCESLKLIFSEITFYSRYDDIRSKRLIEKEEFKYTKYSKVEELEGNENSWFIVDCYDLDICFESSLRSFGRLLVLDDWAHRMHDADILLDHNLGANTNEYKEYVNSDCKILAGEKFLLVKEVLKKSASYINEGIKLLISLGGCDNEGWTFKLVSSISSIESLKNIDIKILVSKKSPSFKCLSETSLGISYELYDTVDDMSVFYEWANLAIGGAGVSAIERSVYGIPSMIVNMAENQLKLSKEVVARKLAIYIGSFIDGYIDVDLVDSILKERKYILDMNIGLAESNLKPGSLNVLKEIISTDERLVELRKIENNNNNIMNNIFFIQNEKNARVYFRNSTPPSWDEHVAWFERNLNLRGNYMWSVDLNGEFSGVIRVVNDGCLINEVSILISSNYRGLGVASLALKKLISLNLFTHLSAEVLEQNKPSIRLFTKVGFRPRGDTGIYDYQY